MIPPIIPRPLFSGLAAVACLLLPVRAAPVISEFMAANDTSLQDEDGDSSDWIELHNPGAEPVQLGGYHLTDDPAEPTKWSFPALSLAPGAYLVVFASDKDRVGPGSELHTNFRLDASGEYLGLVAPDGVTVVNEFAPVYPPQFDDQSFGFGEPGATSNLNVTPVWAHPENYANVAITGVQTANQTAGADSFDPGTGASGTQLYMWFDFADSLSLIPGGSEVTAATLNCGGEVATSVFGSPAVPSDLGVFPVPDGNRGIDSVAAAGSGSDIVDYYAAHQPVAEFRAAPGQTPVASWDIAELVQDWLDNSGDPQRGQLMILNEARPMYMDWDADGAGRPEFTLSVSTTADPGAVATWVYFNTATPGSANSTGQEAGPIFREVTENPPQPVAGPLTITARVDGPVSPVTSVQLFYRRMFGGESSTAMADDGSGGDAVAGDGIYTAVIPAAQIVPGEMTRWRFSALDAAGNETREPSFRDPGDSHRYFGTVGHDSAIETKLPLLQWFVQNPGAANNTSGTRGALYYLGQFYDNVHFSRHGQSTGGFVKKSYNIDFNRTQRFQWSPDPEIVRVADIDLLTNWADKSKVRHPLAYEVMRESGVPAHFAFTVRVEQNGGFFSTADFVEDADDRYLERAGLNPDGALYKAYSNTLTGSANSGFEKKNRKFEDNSDLQELINNLALSGTARTNYLYDNIDIPKCVNMLAANSVIRNIDMHSKNWYIYRDTGRTNEWALLPWDLDLSAGRVWNSENTYFDNNLYTHGFVRTGTSIRLVSHLFSDPEIRSMIMRRIRTLSDRFLQPPGTPVEERWYERRLDEQSALIDPPDIVPSDAQRDFEKWGSWIQGSEAVAMGDARGTPVPYTYAHPDVESMAEAVLRWKNEYLPARRTEIYNRQTVGRGGEIPLPQTDGSNYEYTPLLQAGAPAHAFVPVDNSVGVSWIGLSAFEPFDTSGWIPGTTGVGYERGSGYEGLIGTDVDAPMMNNTSVYIRVPFEVDDPGAFDALELRMQWDDGFVAFLNGTLVASDNAPATVTWNSAALDASHEANAGTFDAYNITDHLSALKAGPNILAIHGLNESTGSSDMIIRPELYGGTAIEGPPGEPTVRFGTIEFSPASGNQDEEYIELVNPNAIAVDISGWKLEGGVEFIFQGGTVIPSAGRLYVSPDVTAFRARAQSPTGGEGRFVQGGYRGHLSSFGETVTLSDPAGNLISSASYAGDPSDAQLYLRVTEVMYHPSGNELAEFIELTNVSDAVTLDLSGIRFTAGIEFDFTGSAVTTLGPGGRVLVVRDLAAFESVHGGSLPVAGAFANQTALNNGGDTVKLEDALNNTIAEFRYDDRSPWPDAADGDGYSLVLSSPAASSDPDVPGAWRSSALPGGNPGGSDALPAPVDPLGDSDGNGVADLVDYALGNGLGSAPIPVRVTLQPYLVEGEVVTLPTLSFPLSLGADGAAAEIDYSGDLQNWQAAGAAAEVISVVNQGDGRAIVTVRLNPAEGTGDRFFARLRIESL